MLKNFNIFIKSYINKYNIRQKIKQLNPWYYELKINDVKIKPGIYPIKKKDFPDTEWLINRQKCRKKLLIDEVIKRFNFNDANILDIGCNCGYWSSIYIIKYGAKYVVGLEGREKFIKQANLYYENLGIKNKSMFILGNVMEIDYRYLSGIPFDFVLCAGILYHIKNYKLLLEKISKANTRALVIDTRISPIEYGFMEPGDLFFNAIEETRDKRIPTMDRLLKLLNNFGYNVEIIPPKFKTIKGVTGVDDYNAGNRVCLFCEKKIINNVN